jgi:predicted nucleic acid-binding protein
LDELRDSVSLVQPSEYVGFEPDARERLGRVDQSDWPILAAALALGCPLWTEDRDFFGTGVATWTSDRVEIYLRLPLGSSPIAS